MGDKEVTSTSGVGHVISPEKANQSVSEDGSTIATLEPKEIKDWFE